MRRILVILSLLALSLGLASAATVSGKVVDAHGKPIRGANVMLDLNLFGGPKTDDLLTDAVGGYAVEVDPTLLRPDAILGHIIAYAPGYTLAQAILYKNDNSITLKPGTTISGVVIDAEGKPLPVVSVRLVYCLDRDNNFAGVPDEWRTRFTVKSGTDGAWTLPGIPLAGTVSLFLNDDRMCMTKGKSPW